METEAAGYRTVKQCHSCHYSNHQINVYNVVTTKDFFVFSLTRIFPPTWVGTVIVIPIRLVKGKSKPKFHVHSTADTSCRPKDSPSSGRERKHLAAVDDDVWDANSEIDWWRPNGLANLFERRRSFWLDRQRVALSSEAQRRQNNIRRDTVQVYRVDNRCIGSVDALSSDDR